MGLIASKTMLLEPVVSDVTDLKQVFERMQSSINMSHMYMNKAGGKDDFDNSGVPAAYQHKMLASRRGPKGEAGLKSVFPLLLHEKDVLRCCSCTHPGVEARLLEAKVAYLDCYTARMTGSCTKTAWSTVVRKYIDELCAYDAVVQGKKAQPDAAKAEFLFGLLFMTCSSAERVRAGEKNIDALFQLIMMGAHKQFSELKEKMDLSWEMDANPDAPEGEARTLNEQCIASLFRFTSENAKDEIVGYGLFTDFLSNEEVSASLASAPALRAALFDMLTLIKEYNVRHLMHYTADLQADKSNMFGALAESMAHQKRAAGEVYDAIAGKADMIAKLVDKKTEIHRRSEIALDASLDVLKSKCGHNGDVRNATVQRWIESRSSSVEARDTAERYKVGPPQKDGSLSLQKC